jgi:amino acid adenylation domain-containing protein
MNRSGIEDVYPLSPVQEGMLFHTLYARGSAVYVNQFSCRLGRNADLPALRRAWQQVVDRHAILRTSFHWEGLDRPLQVVHRQVDVPWEELDWRGLPEREALAAYDRSDLERGFDLGTPPLMRLALGQLEDGSCRLIWTHHHMIMDGWSLPLVLGEVFSRYEALRRGETPDLGTANGYRRYISWLESRDLNRAEDFWKRALRGFTSPTPLPGARAVSGASTSGPYASIGATLPEAVSAALEELAREHRLTVNTLVIGAWALLLGKQSDGDAVFGTTVSGRPADLPGVESIVGLFINTLPFRARLEGNRRLIPWLQELQEAQAESREYEYSPLVQVQGWSEVPRGMPLFESLVVFENYPFDAARNESSLAIRDVRSIESSGYPLTLQAIAVKGVSLRLTYDTRRFEASIAGGMLGHLEALLAGMAAHPGACLDEIDLLTPPERQQLLITWNETGRAYPLERCLHHWIEDQVDRAPNAPAVVFESEQLTYRELDERANHLARRLLALGIGMESRVGVCMERSIEMVVALFAILKAGAAYVPLDPEYPRDRLAYMLANSRAHALLAQEALLGRLPEYGGPILCFDAGRLETRRESGERLSLAASPEQAAYVIYTSGSTGRPKGVVVSHKGIVNRLLWMQEAYGLTSSDRVLQKTPFSFDVSVWELFWPLMTGARLIVARPGGHREGSYLADLILRDGVTTLHFVPSMLRVFLEEPDLARCRALRRVVCSGEALPPDLQERFFERLPGIDLHNLYGPTEASVDVTHWTCMREGPRDCVPIGRPIANTRTHVVGFRLEPLPVGVAGELLLGGVGLARGYLERPELTAEKFVPDPFSGPGERLYRTGDLVRWRPDGAIEFLGRLDHQVKVRGFRIELGEIEVALCQHPGVREAAVVAREDDSGESRLVAYVAGSGTSRVSTEDLRDNLREHLPEHMVPSLFVFLASLPLSPNGKLDRRALPAPDLTRPAVANELVAPRTPEEEVLAAIWSHVLGVEPVGVHDNFFSLGGDSIRSIRVLTLARERGLSLELQQLFETPTIAALAFRVGAAASPPPIVEPFALIREEDRRKLPAEIEDAYPLTMLQAGMLFHSAYAPETAVYHDISSLHIEASLEVELLRDILQRLTLRHPVLRTSFDLAHFSEPLQLVHSEMEVPLEVADLAGLSSAQQERAIGAWIEAEKRRTFEAGRPPLVRFAVHLRGERSFQLSLGFHHAILDGWSLAVLTSELLRLYLAGLGEAGIGLEPEPKASFREYVALEIEASGSAEGEHYWLDRLRDGTRTVLPRWPGPRRDSLSRRVLGHEVPLQEEVSSGLARLARQAAVPIKSVLLAAHLRVLGCLSGQTDVLTGLVSNGRPEIPDGERVLGLFLNTLPFHLEISGGTWLELVQATFAAEREALPFRRYPLAKLQRALGDQPLVETAFNFIHFHVYDSLRGAGRLRVQDARFEEETDLPLVVHFTLSYSPAPEIRLTLAHDLGEFGEQQIRAIGEVYARTLRTMAAGPEERYELAMLLPEADLTRLTAWNATERPYPFDVCLHELIEAQVERSPETAAVVYGGQELTYRELNARANLLAYQLHDLGIGPEERVAICVERSLEMVVGLLGILKAGAAYVPLDPDYPRERLAFMLEDSRAAALLTQERLVEILPAPLPRTILLDTGWRDLARTSRDSVGAGVLPENAAYVIYTSGSTGKPKGAVIPHRGIVNRLLWMQEAYGLTPNDRVLQKTPFSFDVSVWEFFWPLLTGARLVLARPQGHRDPAYLASLIKEQGITTLHFVPSMLATFLGEPAAAGCHCLKRVMCSGEALSPALQERFFERLGGNGIGLHNLYGPTEASVDVTAWRCEPGLHNPVPIGSPVANTQIHVLDTHLRPVPVGSPGELHIAGVQLGRGYLGRPDLTAERFTPDPVGEPGGRLYKTGDLSRWLPNGTLEYLGRLDHQVKVRGFRVEPGEIEVELERHPAVHAVVVAAREDRPGDRRLVAYLTATPKTSPVGVEELREHLRAHLPEYMIPSVFVWLPELPLSPNGKVDRRALPAPEDARPELERPYVCPDTPVERALAEIWSEALGVKKVGIDDDFFALGGDSILSLRVAALARERGIKVTVEQLFRHKTIRELAHQVEEAPEHLLARLDQLSDNEVDSLLAEFLSSSGDS